MFWMNGGNYEFKKSGSSNLLLSGDMVAIGL